MSLDRPDPDQLLRQVASQTKGHGKLKIFFGACAGVGKTYYMLSDAQAKLKDGINVVAGLVETHSRPETQLLLEGIPQLPLRQIEYQGIMLREFDLDAALQTKPTILLVDELAHSNSQGSRHPKRWQDVQEILNSGIDVYTTLNVQHLESLNDIIANITGIIVKETVPDSIFDQADEIVLVDVPSEVIIQRLHEGKVYLGEFAKQRASQHFFKMENLIALREIALRRTAERVDALRDIYQKYRDGSKKQQIADKILVCIGPKAVSTKIVRKAKQQITKMKCPWTVLFVENENYYGLAKEEQMFIERTLRLAEQLGARTETIQQNNIAEAIVDFAKKNNFTRIILGRSADPKWKHFLFGSLVNNIIEKCNLIDVYIVNDQEKPQPTLPRKKHLPWIDYLYATLLVAAITLFSLPAKEWLRDVDVVMIYLAGIVIISIGAERSAAIYAAILSVFCYKFFFTLPYYSLETYHFRDVITIGVLLLMGLVISTLTSRLRLQSLFARQRAKAMEDLYEFSRKMIVTPGKYKIARVAAEHLDEIFDSAITVWLPDATGHLELASHPGIKAELKEESVAQWAYAHRQISGIGTDTMPSARGYYIPLISQEKVLGVLGVIPKDPKRTFNTEESTKLETFCLQIALALERIETAAKKA
ncbi:MAG: DUF4118 domain-containing protein [Candidatus Berkiellales bacterium]